MEISYRHLVQIALQRDLAQQLLYRACHGDPTHDLYTEIFTEACQYLFFMFICSLQNCLGSLARIIILIMDNDS